MDAEESDSSTLDLVVTTDAASHPAAHAGGGASEPESSSAASLPPQADRMQRSPAGEGELHAEPQEDAVKLRSYQGKPLPPSHAHEQMDSSRSGASGVSDLARESENLIGAIDTDAAAPLVNVPLPFSVARAFRIETNLDLKDRVIFSKPH